MTAEARTQARTGRNAIPAEKRSRRAIIDSLKQEGPQDAASLARRLGVSAMAVRQHLYDLEAEGLVTHEAEVRPAGSKVLGRPAKLWGLTEAADRFFPDGHAEFTVGLINSMKQAFGSEGLDKLLKVRAREQVATYRAHIEKQPSLPKKLQALAEIRTAEGYMAEVQKVGGGYLLVENHCPVCSAAIACTGLCNMELEVFQKSLGRDVEVKRIDHILAGARRCAYLVTRKD